MQKRILFLIILLVLQGIIFANSLISEGVQVDFAPERGYTLQLSGEMISRDSTYQKAVYLPEGVEYDLNVQGKGAVQVSERMRLRDVEMAVLSIQPASDFSRNDTLCIEISFSGGVGSLPDRMAASFLRMYEGLFPELRETAGWREIEQAQPNILFIYPENNNTSFWQAYNYLKEWKKQKGYLIYEYELPVTGSSTSLKNYLQDAYDNWEIPPEYICLLGDAGGDYNIPTAYIDSGEGDHYYTLLAGNDQISDAHIGRLSFNTITHMQTIVSKIVNYERNPYVDNTDWFSRVLLTGDPTNSGMSCVYTNINIRELIENNHPEYDYIEVYDEPFVHDMLAGVNDGVSYFNYRGYWGMSNWYDGTADYLNNGMMLPFAVISTCATGNFAGEGTCRSESFLRAGSITNPKGGIGAVGTATSATHTCFNNCYVMGTAYGLFTEDLRTMGAAHTRGKTSLWLNYPQNPDNASTRFSYWNNLMGDPSGEIWIGEPKVLNVDCEPVYARSQENFRIQALNQYDNGVSGLYCSLYNTENDEQHFGYSDDNGYCTFNIAELEADEFMLTVSGSSYYPFQQNIELIESFDLVVSEVGFDDESGNGSFEPDETGMINITISNASQNDYVNISVELSSDDNDILIEEAQTIDYLAAGEEVILENIPIHYSGSGVSEAEKYIRISISFIVGTMVDFFPVPITGMQLTLSDHAFSDDNNNQPEPGETVYLDYELTNSGEGSLEEIVLEIGSSSNLIILSDNIQYPGTLEPEGVYSSSEAIELNILPEYIAGTEAELYFRLYNQSGYEQEIILEFTAGEAGVNEPTGPDEYDYCIYDENDTSYLEVEYDWIEINTENEIPLADSGDMGAVTQVELPFALRFYDQDYTELSVCTNGWVAPGYTESASFMNWTIPGEGGISPIIAVFWDDLKTAGNGGIYWSYDEAQHQYIIEWDNLLNDWDNSVETFQIIIYDLAYYPSSNGNNLLKFQYKIFNNTNQGSYTGMHNGNHGQFATIGIEDQSGTCGVQYTFNNDYPETGAELSNESALMIGGIPIPSESAWIILRDHHCQNAAGEEAIVPGDTVEMFLGLQNIGSEFSDDLTLMLSCDDQQNIEILTGEITITGINAGEEVDEIAGLNFYLSENCPPMEQLEFELEIANSMMCWNYKIRKTVTAALLLIDVDTIDLEEVMCGFVKEFDLEIENSGTALLEITALQSSCPELSVEFESLSVQPGESQNVILSYLSSEIGEINESLTIYSNDILDSILVIPVEGIVVMPPQIVVDTSLRLIEVENGTSIDYSISVENAGEGSLELNARLEGFYNSWLAARFTGGYLNLSQPVITTEEFTIEAWARVDGPGFYTYDTNPIFVQRDNVPQDYHAILCFFAKDVSGSTKFSLQGATSIGLTLVADSPPLGEWHHYAAVVNEETARLYIDGELKAMEINEESGGYYSGVNHICLGAHIYSGEVKSSLNGMLDEVRIWNRDLSAEEIVEYMNKSRELDSNGLIACWNFNEEDNWQDLVDPDLIVYNHLDVLQEDSQAEINDWVQLEDSSFIINGGSGADIVLNIDSNWLLLPDYDYEMNLVLTTNDPTALEVTIPLIVEVVPLADDEDDIYASNSLSQNYPNPFYCNMQQRSLVNIGYTLTEEVIAAAVVIYNIKGQKVTELKIDAKDERKGLVNWDGKNQHGKIAASGVYCYVLQVDGKNVISRKMVLLR